MSGDRTVVYTDGACRGNPGPGGWAWVVPGGRQASGAEPQTTNQRMELTAVLDAVRRLDGPLEIVSDSTYVVNCFRDRWWEGWLARGWLNSQKKPVANRDLWEPLIGEVRNRPVSFRWVKGHAGNEWNDLADQLAVAAADAQQGVTGSAPPVEDPEQARRDPTGREPPEGHRLVIAGTRQLDGDVAALRRRLTEIVAAKAEMHDDLVVLTGLRMGAEQLGADAADGAGVPYVAVLPYPTPESAWPGEEQSRFSRYLEAAQDTITLQAKSPDSKAKARGAVGRRNAWLARAAHEAIVIGSVADEETAKLTRSLEEAVGEEEVWRLSSP